MLLLIHSNNHQNSYLSSINPTVTLAFISDWFTFFTLRLFFYSMVVLLTGYILTMLWSMDLYEWSKWV